MNYDKILLKIFYGKTKLNPNITKKYRDNVYRYPNIYKYFLNRFGDDLDFVETLRRLKYKINIKPKCPICGKSVHISEIKFNNPVYKKYCSHNCSEIGRIQNFQKTNIQKYGGKSPFINKSVQEKSKKTCKEKYGVEYVTKSKEFQERIQKSNLEKYGCISPFGNKVVSQKIKSTNQSKYGVDYPLQNKEIYDKTKETLFQRYQVNSPGAIDFVKIKTKETWLKKYNTNHCWCDNEVREKCKKTMKDKYGVDNMLKLKWVIDKSHSKESILKSEETKRKNHTFNTSKAEEELYDYIKNKFQDVKREYKEERYPWKCDFYIPSLDMFIELNGHYSHGFKPFDETNKYDLLKLNLLKEKYYDFYKKHHRWPPIITTWTILDVKKRKKALENNLNYKEVWNLQEGKEYIDMLFNKYGKV